MVAFTNDQIADFLVYEGGTRPTHWTYSNITVNFSGLPSNVKTMARLALSTWEDLTGVTFTEVGSSAQITFDDNDSGAYASSFGFITSTDIILTDVDVNVSSSWIQAYGTQTDGYAFQTYVHEIGHALGLGHAGHYNGNATFGVDNHYDNDSWQTSVMSYFSQPENTFTNASFAYVATPMIADVLAMWSLYGRTNDLRATDTVYGQNSTAGGIYDEIAMLDGKVAFNIVDDGGYDTIDFSNDRSDQFVNLNDETYSNVGGLIGNMAIMRHTMIEAYQAGKGNDRVLGNELDNDITGNDGNDKLWGGKGNDSLKGNAGNDTLIGGGGADRLFGGSGVDEAAYTEAGSGLIVDLEDSSKNRGQAAGDTLDSIENLSGSRTHGDTLSGNTANNQLLGGGGDDVLQGRGGSDTLLGDWGQDVLQGGKGNDVLKGQKGNDTLEGGAGADRIIGGNGVDEASYWNAGSAVVVDLQNANNNRGEAAGDVIFTVENLAGSRSHDDKLLGDSGNNKLSGGGGNDRLGGRDGNDVVVGGSGNDVLWGGTGVDRLYGGNGDDLLNGGTANGWDGLYGGDGNDTYVITKWSGNVFLNEQNHQSTNDQVLFTGISVQDLSGQLYQHSAGWTRVELIHSNGSQYNILNDQKIEKFVFEDDSLSFDNLLVGGYGNSADTLNGTASDDLILAGGGNDTINGQAGNDYLRGDEGADELNGGLGNDILVGGAGADVFIFDTTQLEGADTISDFEIGVDKLNLNGSNYSDLTIVDTTNGALVSWANGSVELEGILASSLTEDQFL